MGFSKYTQSDLVALLVLVEERNARLPSGCLLTALVCRHGPYSK